ncbi:isochorismatase family protein [Mobilisporobacter senegalensis]|uniref:Isochorismatase family protein n=1 Tax=Mobilisporobacter senegalensis TaxID=1329262 RepID=A0A3N1XW67_9FIRM|nr:isochorismatase family protein [Mobilisporobacter senegalensis]ROR30518.1 isochorismatase family protein [Mobilisporobacter senegalensis]
MRILAEDTIGLIIDYQDRIIPVMDKREELIYNTIKLIKGLKTLQIPLVVSQQYTKGLGDTIESIKDALSEECSYYDKLTFSCLDNTEISDQIKSYNKKNIVVCGIEAHVCVLQTVIDLVAAGYNVIIVEDCITSRKIHDKEIALKRFAGEGVIFATYESILFELTREAGNETFKAISKIIK